MTVWCIWPTTIVILCAELLSSFLEVEAIRRHYKSKLLGPVLHGYLALRKLVVQRTKLVDETQQMLLELLEDMTTGKTWRKFWRIYHIFMNTLLHQYYMFKVCLRYKFEEEL